MSRHPCPGWHNDRVRTRSLRALALGSAVVLFPALTLSACGGQAGSGKQPSPSTSASSSPATPTPSPSVTVPSGVKLTKPGSTLHLGEAATVAYQPNDKRGTVLRIQVQKLQRGTIKQLSAYVLDKNTRKSTPYYVHVKVKNVGTGDVGRTDVPLWVVDQDNTLIHSSSFTNTYRRCQSKSLPKKFGPGQSIRGCLVYLVPDHGRLTGVSFRPLQAVAPIEWHGKVAGEKSHHASKKNNSTKKGRKKS